MARLTQFSLFILLFLGLPNIHQLYRVHLIGNEIRDAVSPAIVSYTI